MDLTENGMGVEGEAQYREDGMIQDDYRIEYSRSSPRIASSDRRWCELSRLPLCGHLSTAGLG